MIRALQKGSKQQVDALDRLQPTEETEDQLAAWHPNVERSGMGRQGAGAVNRLTDFCLHKAPKIAMEVEDELTVSHDPIDPRRAARPRREEGSARQARGFAGAAGDVPGIEGFRANGVPSLSCWMSAPISSRSESIEIRTSANSVNARPKLARNIRLLASMRISSAATTAGSPHFWACVRSTPRLESDTPSKGTDSAPPPRIMRSRK